MSQELWVVYATATGEIVRSGQGAEGSGAGLTLDVGQTLYTELGDSLPQVNGYTHYFTGGVLTAYTGPQATAKRDKPPYLEKAWNNATMLWEDLRTLPQVQQIQAQKAFVNARKAIYGVFFWDSSGWLVDEYFIEDITRAAQRATLALIGSTSMTRVFTNTVGTNRTLDRDQILALFAAYDDYATAKMVAFRATYSSIMAATSQSLALAIPIDGF